MMRNQLARRNLCDLQRIAITHKCEDAVKAVQEKNLHLSNGRGKKGTGKFPEVNKAESRSVLGAMAGVSGKTYEHAVEVIEKAPEPVVQAAEKSCGCSKRTIYTRMQDSSVLS